MHSSTAVNPQTYLATTCTNYS